LKELLDCFSDKYFTRCNGNKKLDLTTDGHTDMVSRITGMCKRTVRQRKDHATVTVSVAIEHLLANRHVKACVTGAAFVDSHAEHL
jgi:hypothetical protein